MKPIKFSIITPVYNRVDCIERCVECVRMQTYCDWEHIIVDDGSTDGTDLLLEKMSRGDSRLKYVRQSKNGGPNSARNKALDIATGSYVLFCDSDDCLAKEALQNIIDVMTKFVGFSYYLFSVDDRLTYYESNPLLMRGQAILSYSMWITGKVTGDFVHVVSRSLWDDIRFNEKYRIYEELTFLNLYKRSKEQFFCNEIIINRDRSRQDSVTNETSLYKKNSIQYSMEVQKKILEEHYDAYIESGVFEMLACKIRKLYFYMLMCRTYDELSYWENKIKVTGRSIPYYLVFIKAVRGGGGLSVGVKIFSYIKYLCKKIRRN
ncbi:glycosyltransferase family 2 protein [Parabacteroides sp. BX2]|jgi:glycosyltransferase involved in cell wall biosynthesis|uniref:Glycosyltransferase family 2 protein n=1 Tax=Parabacteroides segnis TaxID=2763058 RepID=A0ABR7E6W9_9BACT|nr:MULTISPECIES: glycosyltransferase family 2 protein [Parabacteroides]MBC5645490.1 glycosyltransferase family 2 protein [Parabacteroides segnis]MCM0715309.1 glycosyltransferase [Parabacteroides sp. TA-V-105]